MHYACYKCWQIIIKQSQRMHRHSPTHPQQSPTAQTNNNNSNNSNLLTLTLAQTQTKMYTQAQWCHDDATLTLENKCYENIGREYGSNGGCDSGTMQFITSSPHELEPWADRNHEITHYHKMQCLIQKKLHSQRKLSCFQSFRSTEKPKNASTFSNRTNYSHHSTQSQPQSQAQRPFRHKNQQNRQQTPFNTISTSNQQRLKWQLQMEVASKRRKRMSNMLKIRNFGHFKSSRLPEKEKATQLHHYCTGTKEKWGELLSASGDQSPQHIPHNKDTCSKLKIKLRTDIKPQKGEDIENLYSILKAYTHRNQLVRRVAHNLTKNRLRPTSQKQSSSMRVHNYAPYSSQLSNAQTNMHQNAHEYSATHALAQKNSVHGHTQINKYNYNMHRQRQRQIERQRVLQTTTLGQQRVYSKSVNMSAAGRTIRDKLTVLKSWNVHKNKTNANTSNNNSNNNNTDINSSSHNNRHKVRSKPMRESFAQGEWMKTKKGKSFL